MKVPTSYKFKKKKNKKKVERPLRMRRELKLYSNKINKIPGFTQRMSLLNKKSTHEMMHVGRSHTLHMICHDEMQENKKQKTSTFEMVEMSVYLGG